jgi:hypothetical protein
MFCQEVILFAAKKQKTPESSPSHQGFFAAKF